jgi:hypothetical protein
MSLVIRPESKSDENSIGEITRQAFATHPRSSHTEHLVRGKKFSCGFHRRRDMAPFQSNQRAILFQQDDFVLGRLVIAKHIRKRTDPDWNYPKLGQWIRLRARAPNASSAPKYTLP